jgi:hypothetical protein
MTESYESLWAEINHCDVCKHDERIEPEIRERWKKGAFLPLPGVGPEPNGLPVRYLLVAQEPSASWAKASMDTARKKIASGFRNFNITGGDFAIRWAAHKWLVDKGKEAFLLTDLAKCAVAGKDVYDTVPRRYRNCRHFLEREVDIFRSTLQAIVAVGKEAYRWCIAAAEPNWPPIMSVMHHAMRFPPLRQSSDNEGLPTEAEFAKFVKERNPTSTARLQERELNILSVYKVRFAEIKLSVPRRCQTKG